MTIKEKNLYGKKLYSVKNTKECPFCKTGINRIGTEFHSGVTKPDMPHIANEWLGEHYILKNCVRETGIGLSISLINLMEDAEYDIKKAPVPMLNASIDIKNHNGITTTEFPDVSIPIRFCPMCGREIGNIEEACQGEFDTHYNYSNPYKKMIGAIFGTTEVEK